MRIVCFALVACLTATASANTSHHSSSGGGQAECIRWEPIPGADLGEDSDGGADDGGTGSSSSHEGLRCAERASLFSCSFAATGGGGWGVAAIGMMLALALGRRRRV